MTEQHYKDNLSGISLGQTTEYKSQYDASLLYPVPRELNRSQLDRELLTSMKGIDIWNGFELSWLNPKGKPVVALAKFYFQSQSENIVESKSFKLYLNSFNQTNFDSFEHVKQTLISDLQEISQGVVEVELFKAHDIGAFQVTDLPGDNIDELDINITDYQLNESFLQLTNSSNDVTETLNSHLLKSNCLITSQPDWASIVIEYSGKQIDRESLLRYLISFRMHNEFHEQCVERIFADIMKHCQPKKLTVYARYTRRGGLDINPFRSNTLEKPLKEIRINRQ